MKSSQIQPRFEVRKRQWENARNLSSRKSHFSKPPGSRNPKKLKSAK